MATTPASSDVAHLILTAHLVKLRNRAGLSQEEAAKKLRCAQSRITHIERQRNAPRYELLREMLRVYEAEDWLPELEHLLDLTQRREWWKSEDFSSDAAGFSTYVGLFAGASRAEVFEMRLIHGLLQTEDYAREVIRSGQGNRDVETKVAARMRLREAITREPNPVPLEIILDEMALKRRIGTPEIMQQQYAYLLKLAEHENIHLRITPADVGWHPALTGSFELLHFPIEDHHGFVMIDSRTETIWLKEKAQVDHYSQVMARAQEAALRPDDSITLIEELAKEKK